MNTAQSRRARRTVCALAVDPEHTTSRNVYSMLASTVLPMLIVNQGQTISSGPWANTITHRTKRLVEEPGKSHFIEVEKTRFKVSEVLRGVTYVLNVGFTIDRW